MEQKKQEKDVLIVRDEKTGEISVVAGLDKDGNPKRIPAKAENAKDFLVFDRGGDVLDNFFKNFVRQCKEPNRFGFYRMAADKAEHLIGVMKDLLKNPEANKELLAPHKIDLSEYDKKVKAVQTQSVEPKNKEEMKKENEEKQEQTQTEGKRKGYQPIDESKIDWQKLEERWGIRRDDLEKSGDLEKMLNYGKSNLVTVTPTFGDEKFETAARLSFKPQEDGSVRLVPHLIQKEANLKEEFKGYKFSAEDAKNLRETGNMGRVADLVDKSTGEITPSFVSIDRQTNEITSIPVSRIKWKDTIGNTKLSQPEMDLLKTGAPLVDKEIQLSNGRKFKATLQVNVEQRGIEFVPKGQNVRQSVGDNRQEQGQKRDTEKKQETSEEKLERNRKNWLDANGEIKPINKWKNVEFNDQQKADYVAGKTVKLEKVVDAQGKEATMYLKFNREAGRPYVYNNNPDTAQKVAPSNESRTQVAVNNEGKTNEATKHVKEPLKQGQTAPDDKKQHQEQKQGEHQQPKQSKGVKM